MLRNSKLQGIYKITHLSSGRVYIGSAVDIEKRWSTHRSSFSKKGRGNPYLSSAWIKYGQQDFSFEVVELVGKSEDLLKREQYWIDKHDATNRDFGFNIAPKAGSSAGVKRTKETNEKIIAKQKGTKRTEATKLKMSEAAMGNKNGLGSHWHGSLTQDDVLCIFDAVAKGEHTKSVSIKYNVSVATIGRIITRATWWSVDVPNDVLESAQLMYKNQRKQSLRSTKSVTKLSPYQVSVIKRKILDGQAGAKIALEFGVKPETIYAIKSGRIWADIAPL
jgi:group I intron endonuclease